MNRKETTTNLPNDNLSENDLPKKKQFNIKKKLNVKTMTMKLFLLNFLSVFVIVVFMCFLITYTTRNIITMYDDYYGDQVMSQYQLQCKWQVESIMQIIENEFNNVKSGLKSRAEAKHDAAEAVRKLRYGDDNSGYYWIDDITGMSVMHPITPDIEGTNNLSLTDKNGVKIMEEIIKAADNEKGYGYSEYLYTKADGKTVGHKVTYSQKFEPWNWIISTGTYVDDSEKEISNNLNVIYKKANAKLISAFGINTFLCIIAALVTLYISKKMTRDLINIKDMAETMQKGDLRSRKKFKSQDEIGLSGRALNKAQEQIVTLIDNINQVSSKLGTALNNFSKNFTNMNYSIQTVSTSIEEITDNINTQALSTSEASESIDKIARSIENTSIEVDSLERNSKTMQLYSRKSMDSLNQLLSINERTKHDIDEMYTQTENTNLSVKKISQAADLISQIAEETNLLSLNASIEAARAGEEGKGFAVVASEIGALAAKSSETVTEITNILKELTTNSIKSVNIMETMNQSSDVQVATLQETKQIFEDFRNILDLCFDSINTITLKIQDVNSKREAITTNIISLTDVATNNAAFSEETTATVAELKDLVSKSNTIIQSLSSDFNNLTDSINSFKI